MKEETYKKVYIRSEADLPKEGKYDTMFKTKHFYDQFTYDPSKNKKYWLDTVDWYLQPIEPLPAPVSDEMIKKYLNKEQCLSSGPWFRVCMQVAKAMRDGKIK